MRENESDGGDGGVGPEMSQEVMCLKFRTETPPNTTETRLRTLSGTCWELVI